MTDKPRACSFFKGHYHVAWGILEIAQAQYSPPDQEKKLYQLRMDDGDDDPDFDSGPFGDSNGNHQPRVVSKTVDEKFTIDNVGEVSMQVQSRVTAIDYMLWPCNTFEVKDGVPDIETCTSTLWEFFTQGVDKDMRMFEHFLDMCVHFGAIKDAASGIDQNSSGPGKIEFQEIIEWGKVKILKEAIRRTGAGIPLDALVKESGVEVTTKPKYYQGLSVYGKKRYVPVLSRPSTPYQVYSVDRNTPSRCIAACQHTSNPCLFVSIGKIGPLLGVTCLSSSPDSGPRRSCMLPPKAGVSWWSGS